MAAGSFSDAAWIYLLLAANGEVMCGLIYVFLVWSDESCHPKSRFIDTAHSLIFAI
jgi:hypothetical protein